MEEVERGCQPVGVEEKRFYVSRQIMFFGIYVVAYANICIKQRAGSRVLLPIENSICSLGGFRLSFTKPDVRSQGIVFIVNNRMLIKPALCP